jgi:hypothetical protein
MGGRLTGFAAGRFSRITLAFGFFFPPFRFMSLLWQRSTDTSNRPLLSD